MKKNFNVPVEENVSDDFEKWQSGLPGGKGEKLTAALKAIQALHATDENLIYKLMNPNITVKQSCDVIFDSLIHVAYEYSLEKLNPQEKAQLLKDALNSKRKVSHKT